MPEIMPSLPTGFSMIATAAKENRDSQGEAAVRCNIVAGTAAKPGVREWVNATP